MDNRELRLSNSEKIILHQFGISLVLFNKFNKQGHEIYSEYMVKYDE